MTGHRRVVDLPDGLGLRIDRTGYLIDARGVAHLTGWAYTTVRQRVWRRELPPPAGQIGQAFVWWADDIARWEAAGRPTVQPLEWHGSTA